MIEPVKVYLRRLLLNLGFLKLYFGIREVKEVQHSVYSESVLIHFYLKYFEEYKTMLDVGAHFGESFKPYEKLNWKVYVFEPDPSNRARISFNPVTTKLFDVAITNQDDLELQFYTSTESTGISSLHAFHSSHQASIRVKTKTLDTVCRQENINEVDFLKIDTEGHDLFVLQGFPFDRITPQVILCEFEDSKTELLGYTYHDLGNYLVKKGYLVYISEWFPIVRYGVQHVWRDIRPFPSSLHDPNGWGNFIAIRPEAKKRFEKIKSSYLKTVKR